MATPQMAISVIPEEYSLVKTDGYGRRFARKIKSSSFVWSPKPVILTEQSLQGWNTERNAWMLTTSEGSQPVCKFEGLETESLKRAMAQAINHFATTGEPCFLGVAGGNSLERWFCAIAHNPPAGKATGDVCPWLS